MMLNQDDCPQCGQDMRLPADAYQRSVEQRQMVDDLHAEITRLKAQIESLAPEAEERETRAAYEQLKCERDALLTVAQAAQEIQDNIRHADARSVIHSYYRQPFKCAIENLQGALTHPAVQARLKETADAIAALRRKE